MVKMINYLTLPSGWMLPVDDTQLSGHLCEPTEHPCQAGRLNESLKSFSKLQERRPVLSCSFQNM